MQYSLIKIGGGPGLNVFKNDIHSLSELLSHISPEAQACWEPHLVPDNVISVFLGMYSDGRSRLNFLRNNGFYSISFNWDSTAKKWVVNSPTHAHSYGML
jgi:hypothetical protein